MASISISQKEYQQLLDKALRYDYLRQLIREDFFASPPTRSIKEIVRAFEATNLYKDKFIKSLERGLKRSSYFSNK